ncbi:MAG: hypothetical protein LBH85_07725 [Treponema sp.]|nr:hypothetical protein [Treponema sp.]
MKGKRYAFRYDHEYGNIEIREDSVKGRLLHKINNKNTIADLKAIFQAL